MHHFIVFLIVSLLCTKSVVSQSYTGIIPQPQSLTIGKDWLLLKSTLTVEMSMLPTNLQQYLKENLFERHQIFVNKTSLASVDLVFQPLKGKKTSSMEGYELNISTQKVIISASTEMGYFNAINSFLQLIDFNKNKNKIKIPVLNIVDHPSLQWRGLMLDESRHFFGKEKVKQLLDWMAYYKLNKFHWHLTDESAWRIEIKQYPFLTLVGGVGTYLNPLTPAQYYTQEEIKDIVAYAAQRYIEIIPEIDMPGHATAANRAYPQFSGGGTKDHPDFTFHPAKEGTYKYLSNILKEVNMLFPSNKIHLGGDEVSFGSESWNADSSIKELKAKYNFTTNKEVENYFMRRMADSLFQMGTDLVTWDEMADSGLPANKTIQMWWRHDKPAQLDLLLKNGYPTIISPRIPFYFDFVQAESHQFGRKWGKVYNPIEALYHYNVDELKKKETYNNQILGVQGNLWTERVHNENRLDFMIFPRIAALAETAWSSNDRKNYANFSEILKKHIGLYQADGIYYFDPFSNSNPEPKVKTTTKKYIDNPE